MKIPNFNKYWKINLNPGNLLKIHHNKIEFLFLLIFLILFIDYLLFL